MKGRINRLPMVMAMCLALTQLARGAEVAPLRTLPGRTVTFSPDGRLLAAAQHGDAADRVVKVYEVATGAVKWTLAGHTGYVSAAVFSPDGRSLATGGNGTVILWDMDTGLQRGTLSQPMHDVMALAFAPGGNLLAIGGTTGTEKHRGAVKLWDLGRSVTTIDALGAELSFVTSVAFSPDGSILAVAHGDKGFVLWDVTRQRAKLYGGADEEIFRIAFSPDGKWLAGGGHDAAALWDAASGVRRLHWEGAMSLAFSPDGRLLAGGPAFTDTDLAGGPAANENDRLWDVRTGWELLRLPHLVTEVTGDSVAFSPDGHVLATADDLFGEIKLWDLTACHLPAGPAHPAVTDTAVVVDGDKLRQSLGNDPLRADTSQQLDSIASVALAEGATVVFDRGAVVLNAGPLDISDQVAASLKHSAAAGPPPALPPLVVGVVDTGRMVGGYKAYQEALANRAGRKREDVDAEFAEHLLRALAAVGTARGVLLVLNRNAVPWVSPAAEMTDEVLANLNGTASPRGFNPPAAAVVGVIDEARLAASYRAYQEALKNPAGRKVEDLTRDYTARAAAMLATVAAERHLTLVARRAGAVLSLPERDVTDAVLARLNANSPATANP